MKKMGDERLEDALRSKKCEGGGDKVDARDVGGEWDRVHCRDCTTDDAAAPIVAVKRFAHMAGLRYAGMYVNGI